MEDLSIYQQAKENGASATDLYLKLKSDGMDQIQCTRILRALFELDLSEAKAVIVHVETGKTKEEHERLIIRALDTVPEDEIEQ